jgi:type IV pilus assembly protein PilE
MERWYTTNMSYVDAPAAPGCANEGGLNNHYTITVDSDERTYTVTATPQNAQITRDSQCGTLTLDQAGTRDRTGSGEMDYCWAR